MSHNQNYPVCPCKGCTDRFLGCHSKCSSYKDFRTNLDNYNDYIKTAKQANKIVDNYQMNNVNISRK